VSKAVLRTSLLSIVEPVKTSNPPTGDKPKEEVFELNINTP
jgi:hypothetical protein